METSVLLTESEVVRRCKAECSAHMLGSCLSFWFLLFKFVSMLAKLTVSTAPLILVFCPFATVFDNYTITVFTATLIK